MIGVVDLKRSGIAFRVTGTLTAPSAPDGYVITAVLKADFYSYTVLAVRRDRRLVVMDVGYPTQSTVLRVTDLGLGYRDCPTRPCNRTSTTAGCWCPSTTGRSPTVGSPRPVTATRTR